MSFQNITTSLSTHYLKRSVFEKRMGSYNTENYYSQMFGRVQLLSTGRTLIAECTAVEDVINLFFVDMEKISLGHMPTSFL